MIVAGVMSGTSADGIDVALVEIGGRAVPKIKVLGHSESRYTATVRKAVLAAMNARSASVADLARLNFLLGELYADAVTAAQKKIRGNAELVGCHGQTLYHQGSAASFLGRNLAVTWQTGEASRIAARVGVPVVSDFRPGDMAVGGKGAPLVSYLDYLLYRDRYIGRVALNIGGIANITAIPANATLDEVVAFDTGPGNMVMDALAEDLFGELCDQHGKIASRGNVLDGVIARFLRRSFFLQKPPKTAGREEFGSKFASDFVKACFGRRNTDKIAKRASVDQKADVLATATAFTARSIADALERHVLPRDKFAEVIASGGGTRNPTLMAMLANELKRLRLVLRTSDEFGMPSQAKEAVAFAVLAYETWNRRTSNVPSATGARRAAVLGKISYP